MRILIIILFLLLFTCPVLAANNAETFLDKGLGARPLSLGGAYTALAEGADASFYNPAGLALEKKSSFSGSSVNFFGDVNYHSTSVVLPSSFLNGTVSLGFSQSNIDSVPKSYLEDTGRPIVESYFSESKQGFHLSYGKSLGAELSTGFNFKYLTHNLYESQAVGLGVDLGLLYSPLSLPIRLGLNIHNLFGIQMKWSTGNDDIIPRELIIGSAYFGKFLGNNFNFSSDAELKENRSLRLCFGAEYFLFKDLLALRLGLNPEEFGGGIGLNFRNFSLDYAYVLHQDLGITNRLSFGWKW